MKNAISLSLIARLALAVLSFTFLARQACADEAIAPAATPTAQTSLTPSAPPKASYSDLKELCLKDNPALKGRELRKCVKGKKEATK